MDIERITSGTPRSLREWRERAEINRIQAAKRLRISQSYYSKLERKTRHASGKMAKRIHQKTQVPIPVLVGAA